jgi:catechol 2,3-dioxygenase-like lactoylglutathione lyase family enzyme
MLKNYDIRTTIPVRDMQRARSFYAEKLGLRPTQEAPDGVIYQLKGSQFALYRSAGAGTAQHTIAGWTVEDIEAEVGELRAQGVVFEEYDLPNLKTVNGIAAIGPSRAAWFRDSEGNILGIMQES